MNRIVLDTNVLVSGMLNAHAPPGRIVDMIRENVVTPVVDDRILTEYQEALTRPKFQKYFDLSEIRDILLFLSLNSEYCVPTRCIHPLPDPDDAPFAEVADAAAAPLVTGNTAHFPNSVLQHIQVLTPKEFVERS